MHPYGKILKKINLSYVYVHSCPHIHPVNRSLILKNERGLNYLAQCAASSTLGREIGIEC